jgi:sialic acid synthase SpsE
LQPADLTLKKPGSGIPADRLSSLIGMRLRRSVERDAMISMDDLEETE